ncbi:carnitine acyltransferase, putative, partial [Ixodes scapularis]
FRDELDVLIYKFQNYGKDFVKSRNMSPDSFVQMALQLAFYKIHNVPCAMYESVSTREFLHGRTEGVRGTSSQSLNFCRTFESPHSTREQKEHSLRKAVAKHKHDANLVSARCDAVMMIAPLARDGYRVFYNVLKDAFNFGVSCFKSCPETSAVRFKEALEQSLTEMRNCVAQPPRKARHACSSSQLTRSQNGSPGEPHKENIVSNSTPGVLGETRTKLRWKLYSCGFTADI